MWLAEVKAKAKRKNQILFSKDSLLLTDLCQLIAQANRRALILWALELAEETARELAGKYPEDHRPLDAINPSHREGLIPLYHMIVCCDIVSFLNCRYCCNETYHWSCIPQIHKGHRQR